MHSSVQVPRCVTARVCRAAEGRVVLGPFGAAEGRVVLGSLVVRPRGVWSWVLGGAAEGRVVLGPWWRGCVARLRGTIAQERSQS